MTLRRILGTAATTLLVVAVVALACWFAYAKLTGATIVVFRTGSMTPSMPQGSAAITVPTPASDLSAGDVVTVQRAGEALPVTHRVVEVGPVVPRAANAADIRAAAPGGPPPDLASPDARQLVLQGDDNASPDHLPYALTGVDRVAFALPAAGSLLMFLQSPIGLGFLILTAGGLVAWAFWPKSAAAPEAPHRSPVEERTP